MFCFPLCAMRMILSDRMNYNPGMMTEGDSCTIWSQKPPFSSKRRVFLPFEAVSVCSYSVGLERGRARWLLVILQESWPGSPNSDTVTVCVFYFGGLCSFLFVYFLFYLYICHPCYRIGGNVFTIISMGY